jgi:hypothetical protein
MLIRRSGKELLIVRQTDHMAQVARIAERWGNELFPAPAHREETIRAAGLHDNGWRAWEDQPTLIPETGRPRNLGEIERPVHAAFYRQGVLDAAAIDPYTGLLVSLHAAALYAGIVGWNPETLTPPILEDRTEIESAFILEQAALQEQLRSRLAQSPRYGKSVEPASLWPAYLRLRAWDSLSLYFVFHGLGEGGLDHVPTGEGETSIALRQVGEKAATADPWPFDRSVVALPVVVVRVPDRAYNDGRDFLAMLVAARPEVEEFTLRAKE